MALVEIRQLEIRYGSACAVRQIDLDVREGDLLALVGPSGCGKTSLLRAIAGFETPTSGTIQVASERVVGPDFFVPPERRRIGMVFQQGALFPHLTVGQNVLYGLNSNGAESTAQVSAALGLVGMEHCLNRFPDELSGGEQQRVALARAIAPRPRLILLDEPFASLDAPLRRRLREDLRQILEEARITAVLVTHDQEEALSIASRIAVMKDGQILQTGTPKEVYHQPCSLDAALVVGEAQLIPGLASRGLVSTDLGTVSVESVEDGKVWVLIRPEDLTFLPANSEIGNVGTVVRQHFFGHDLLDEVELENGLAVKVRVLSSWRSKPGERVRLSLRAGAFPVFPAENPAADQLEPSVLSAV